MYIMKKTLFLLLLAVAMFVACDKDSYRHEITIMYPPQSVLGANVYADQPKDSIVFVTFDSYQATTQASWITIDPNMAAMKIENSYWAIYQISIPLTFEPNTSGETRYGIVSIRNYGDDWDETVTAGFLQLGWHEVTTGSIVYDSSFDAYSYSYPLTAHFAMSEAAEQVTDSLGFTVHDTWELECESDFLKLGATSGEAGHNVVELTIEENESKEDRAADIFLKSSGATTKITLTQSGAEEE